MNTYTFSRGNGNRTISSDGSADSIDTLRFLAGINPEHMRITRSGRNLQLRVLSINGGNDEVITVTNFFNLRTIFPSRNLLVTINNPQYEFYKIEFASAPDIILYPQTIRTQIDLTDGNNSGVGHNRADYLNGFGGNDTISGRAGNDTLIGGAGEDELSGGTDDDTLIGGIGDDNLSGQAGNDTYLFGRGDGNDVINNDDNDAGSTDILRFLAGINPGDVIVSREPGISAGFAAPVVDDLRLTVQGKDGSADGQITVRRFFGGGADEIDAVEFDGGIKWGIDQIHDQLLIAMITEGKDILSGHAGNNIIDGLGGNDELSGDRGNDTLIGGAGHDELRGGPGNDQLRGGTGNDELRGGKGNDTYIFGRGDGRDSIYNHDKGEGREDVLRFLEGINPGDITVRAVLDRLDLHIGDPQVTGDTGDIIELQNFFKGSQYQLNKIIFFDNTEWTAADIAERFFLQQGEETGDSEIIKGSSADNSINGSGGDDQLYGGDGDDTLRGNTGNDTLSGNAGNDTYQFGRGDGFTLIYNDDNAAGRTDTLHFLGNIKPSDITVSAVYTDLELRVGGDGQVAGDIIRVVDFFSGSRYEIDAIKFSDGIDGAISTEWSAAEIARDFFTAQGTRDNDIIRGTSGGEELKGLGGDDHIYGGDGVDTLRGGEGDDFLYGQNQDDELHGAVGDDHLFGGGGDDKLRGDEDNDELYGGDGNDELRGGTGNDALYGDAGNDKLRGGADDDELFGGDGDDTLRGGAGNDTYIFSKWDGKDSIHNDDDGTGHDVLRFLEGINPGDITARAVLHRLDVLIGDPEVTGDIIELHDFFNGSQYEIDGIEFGDGTVWDSSDIAENFFLAQGTGSSDIIMGSSGKDRLNGLGGTDHLYGGDGNDTLSGNGGADTLSGGAGNNTYLFSRGDGNDTIFNFDDDAGEDTLRFLAGINPEHIRITRSGRNLQLRVLSINGGNDEVIRVTNFFNTRTIFPSGNLLVTINPQYEFYKIEFASAPDIILYPQTIRTQIDLTDGNNSVVGHAGDDYLNGLGGNDAISGRAGNDTLIGGAGNDELSGGTDDDTLIGGIGDDNLAGQAGNDTYLFSRGDGNDVINNDDNDAGSTDILRFLAGINPGDVIVSREPGIRISFAAPVVDDLRLTVQGKDGSVDGQIMVRRFFGGSADEIDAVEFADGTVWDADALRSIVQFNATHAGQTITGDDDANKNDIIYGLGGNDTLRGGEGRDELYGGEGDDDLRGGAGNDTLRGGAGTDSLNGGGGNDIYEFARGDGKTTIHNDDAVVAHKDILRFLEGISPEDVSASRVDTAGAEDIAGSELRLTVQSSDGSSNEEEIITIRRFFTGSRHELDEVIFADGTVWNTETIKRQVQFTGGNDTQVTGHDKDDYLNSLGGDDTLRGGAGNDTLRGGTGTDNLYGEAGNDTYLFSRGDGATFINNDDNAVGRRDILRFLAGINPSEVSASRVNTGGVEDVAGSDLRLTVQGIGESADEIITVVKFFAGNQVNSQYELNAVEFADGTVWNTETIKRQVQFTEDADTQVTGHDKVGAIGDDNYLSGDDYLNGLGGSDTLRGGSGNDSLFGGAGNDTLVGDTGTDHLYGGAGDDSYQFGRGDGATFIHNDDDAAGRKDILRFLEGINPSDVSVTRATDSQDLLLTVESRVPNSAGEEVITQEIITVVSFFADNQVNGQYELNAVEFADGTVWDTDALKSIVRFSATHARDINRGANDNDIIYGLGGDDELRGRAGDDTLIGGAGNDDLFGEGGNDILRGGAGTDDSLDGGAGDDSYLFARGDGNTTIHNDDDGENREDKLHFLQGINPGHVSATRVDTDGIEDTEGDDLRLTVQSIDANSPDEIITVVKFFAGSRYELNEIVFADNTVWDADTLKSSAGLYEFARGDGNTTINNDDNGEGRRDILRFLQGINPGHVSATRVDTAGIEDKEGDDLLLTVQSIDTNPDEIITVRRFFAENQINGQYELDAVEFSDATATTAATVWNTRALKNLALVATEEDDIIIGNANKNIIDGLGGDDELRGGEGHDTLRGNTGTDNLYGDAGNDTYLFSIGDGSTFIHNDDDVAGRKDILRFLAGIKPSDVRVSRATDSDVSANRATSSDDLLLTVESNDGSGSKEEVIAVVKFFAGSRYELNAVEFEATPDIIWNAETIKRQVQFTEGADTQVTGHNKVGAIGDANYLSGDDYLNGLGGNDSISGLNGNDSLFGGEGDDTLRGGEGNDTLRGNAGNDTLYGDAGDDSYLFGIGDGKTTIHNDDDAAVRTDKLRFLEGITPDDVRASRVDTAGVEDKEGDNLLLTVESRAPNSDGKEIITQEVITVVNFFATGQVNGQYELNAVEFSDGTATTAATVWNTATLKELVLVPVATNGPDIFRGSDRDDIFDALGGKDELYGGGGNDTLRGGADDDILQGDKGTDNLYGDAGNDTYLFNIGDGATFIHNDDDVAGRKDILRFLAGIKPSDVSVSRATDSDVSASRATSADDLLLTVESNDGSGSKEEVIAVVKFFADSRYELNAVEFADTPEIVWNAETIKIQVTFTEGDDKGVDNQGVLGHDKVGAIGDANYLSGDDYLNGLGGNDSISGLSGNDRLFGGEGDDTLRGGEGNDTLRGNTGTDHLYGDAGNDTYEFGIGDGSTFIHNDDDGTDRNDILRFLTGITPSNITVSASANGLDLLVGNPAVIGDSGDSVKLRDFFKDSQYEIDEIRFSDGIGGIPDTVWDFADIATTYFKAAGTPNNDIIIGTSGFNVLNGLAGNDYLYGGEGQDILIGGEGEDTLNGGAGSDTYNFVRGHGTTTIYNDDDGANSRDTLTFFSGINPGDVRSSRVNTEGVKDIAGNDLRLTVKSIDERPDDIITVVNFFADDRFQIDAVEFADGTVWNAKTIEIQVTFTEQNDTRDGHNKVGEPGDDNYLSGDDYLDGLGGNDSISGLNGNDSLFGGEGDDTLRGGEGNDTLRGNAGNDTLYGDAGDDSYIFGIGDGKTTIHNDDDAAVRTDKLRFLEGITPDDVRASRVDTAGVEDKEGDNLLLTVESRAPNSDGEEIITVVNFFAAGQVNGQYELNAVEFSDGTATTAATVWNTATLKELVLVPVATNGPDIFRGSDEDDIFDALGGNDELYGGGGNDILRGGADHDILQGDKGTDNLYGDAGNDTYLFNIGDGATFIHNDDDGEGRKDILRFLAGIKPSDVSVSRATDSDVSASRATSSDDLLLTVESNDGSGSKEEVITVVKFFAADQVNGQYELNAVEFSDATATTVATVWNTRALKNLALVATEEDDIIIGNANKNIIDGLGGDDELRGGEGHDELYGGAGDDELFGDGGNDILRGNSNDESGLGDRLYGGAGNDTYEFGIGDGSTFIHNNDAVAGRTDKLRFLQGINPEHVSATRVDTAGIEDTEGDDLRLTVKSIDTNPDEIITVVDFFAENQVNGQYEINAVEFEDNSTVWDADALKSIVKFGATHDRDIITGTTENDIIYGLGGHDELRGGDGHDELYGGVGNDQLYGGEGNDTLRGGTDGLSELRGEAGDDTYLFSRGDGRSRIFNNDSEGHDVLRFLEGINPGDLTGHTNGLNLLLRLRKNGRYTNESVQFISFFEDSQYEIDKIEFSDGTGGAIGTVWDSEDIAEEFFVSEGTSGHDIMKGTSGVDTFNGLGSSDSLFGGDGDDVLRGGDSFDHIYGQNGNDTLYGDAGNDTLYGGDDNDVLRGGADIDFLSGGEGDDELYGGEGNDSLHGNGGSDAYHFSAGFGVDSISNPDRSTATDVARFDDSISVEDLWFSRVSNDIRDDLRINVVGTNDQITIAHWYGRNWRLDKFEVRSGTSTLVLLNDQVDRLVAEMATYSVPSGVGSVVTQEMKDALAPTIAEVWRIRGTEGDDIIVGNANKNIIDGLGGDDELRGGEGHDELYGGAGDDELFGDGGNDILRGNSNGESGLGDRLYGGAGNDTYEFGIGDGSTFIHNYDDGENRNDVVRFLADITPSNVSTSRAANSDDLLLTVQSSDRNSDGEEIIKKEVITLVNFFAGSRHELNEVVFADNTVWNADTLNALKSPNGLYEFARGDGNTTINNNDDGEGRRDILRFLEGIKPSDVSISRATDSEDLPLDDLLLTVQSSDGSGSKEEVITVVDFFAADQVNGQYELNAVEFVDSSTVWDADALKSIVQFGTTHDRDIIRGDVDDDNKNDIIYGLRGNDTLRGGDGHDELFGGDGGDVLYGGAGNDTLRGDAGTDHLYGEAGNDTYLFGRGDGRTFIHNDDEAGEGRRDKLRFLEGINPGGVSVMRRRNDLLLTVQSSTTNSDGEQVITQEVITVLKFFAENQVNNQYELDAVEFTDSSTVWDADALKSIVKFGATHDRDIITGTTENDIIYGLGGNDDLRGGTGHDTIIGGEGDDELRSGTGNDTIYGGEGKDILRGGNDDDTLRGGEGNDTLLGGEGNDHLYGDAGNDTYLFDIGDGSTFIHNDDDAAGRKDILRFLAGIKPSDVSTNRAANSDDLLLTVESRAPNSNGEEIIKKEVITLVNFFAGSRYELNEVVFAGNTVWNADTLNALKSPNGLYEFARGDGNTSINNDDDGEGRRDILRFLAGINPGDVSISRATDSNGLPLDDLLLTVESNDGSGSKEEVIAVVKFFAGAQYELNAVEFEATPDIIWNAETIKRQVQFTEGADTQVTGHDKFGEIGDDNYLSGDDYLNGLGGNDSISGLNGNDQLFGGEGDDTLRGGEGDDTLRGNTGNDTLYGDAGNDTYEFGIGDGATFIHNDDDGKGRRDVLRFLADITPSNVSTSRAANSDDLLLTVESNDGSGSKEEVITVVKFFAGSRYELNAVEFADNTVWNADALNALKSPNGLYEFGIGDGATFIHNDDATTGRKDILRFLAGINPSDVSISRATDSNDLPLDDLLLTVQSRAENSDGEEVITKEVITVVDFFAENQVNGQYEINAVEFEDSSTVWDADALKSIVQFGATHGNNRITGDVDDDNKNDIIYGLGGNDIISGLSGNDRLFGGEGDDTLRGGAGTDNLYGDAGNDTYLFDIGDGSTFIHNDDDGENRNDVVRFLAGIKPSDVSVSRATDSNDLPLDDDLLLTVESRAENSDGEEVITQEIITVVDFFAENQVNGQHEINAVEFVDSNTVWDADVLKSIVKFGATHDRDIITGTTENDIIYGLGGNDDLRASTGHDTVVGGEGDDELRGGSGNDTIYGGEGKDILRGGDDDDTLRGGEGNDTLLGGEGNDHLYGDAGNDTYEFARGDGAAFIHNDDDAAGREDILRFLADITPSNVSTSRAANSDDLLLTVESRAPNSTGEIVITKEVITVVKFFAGSRYELNAVEFADSSTVWNADALNALKSPNGLYEFSRGDGNTTINNDDGGEGRRDILRFLTGIKTSDVSISRAIDSEDLLLDDLLLTVESRAPNSDGEEIITQEVITVVDFFAADQVNGQHELNAVEFEDSSTVWDDDALKSIVRFGATHAGETIIGDVDDDNKNDIIYGLGGNDTISGLSGNDRLFGGQGDDVLEGGAGVNWLFGGEGNDELLGGTGRDYLFGGADNDTLRGGGTSSGITGILQGDAGNDIYLFGRMDGQINISNHDDDEGRKDILRFLEDINPSNIIVRASFDGLVLRVIGSGRFANDRIILFNFFKGSEYEIDEIRFSDAKDGVPDTVWDSEDIANRFFTTQATSGNDIFKGSSGVDTFNGLLGQDNLYGGDGNDILRGGEGRDTVYGQNGNDTLYGGDGDDFLYGSEGKDELRGGADNDWVYGQNGGDTLYGDGGNDRLLGGAGNDILYGGADNDVLWGEDGDDELYGGEAGNDSFRGGSGSDTYHFSAGFGVDAIFNYSGSRNETDVDVAHFADVSIEDLWFSRVSHPFSISRDSLQINVVGTNDQITILQWYEGSDYELDKFEVESGTSTSVLLNSQVDRLVNAMAAYSVPSGVGSVVTQEVKDALAPTIAAVWKTETTI